MAFYNGTTCHGRDATIWSRAKQAGVSACDTHADRTTTTRISAEAAPIPSVPSVGSARFGVFRRADRRRSAHHALRYAHEDRMPMSLRVRAADRLPHPECPGLRRSNAHDAVACARCYKCDMRHTRRQDTFSIQHTAYSMQHANTFLLLNVQVERCVSRLTGRHSCRRASMPKRLGCRPRACCTYYLACCIRARCVPCAMLSKRRMVPRTLRPWVNALT